MWVGRLAAEYLIALVAAGLILRAAGADFELFQIALLALAAVGVLEGLLWARRSSGETRSRSEGGHAG